MIGFGTVSHSIHRKRRAAINPLFSKNTVAASEILIYEQVDSLLGRIHGQINQHGSAEMRTNYLAFATDVVTSYCFEQPTHLLANEKEAEDWKSTIGTVASLTPVIKQFGWILPLALRLPVRLVEALNSDLVRVIKLRSVSRERQ